MLGVRKNEQITEPRRFSWMESYSRRQKFKRMAHSLLSEKDDVLSDLGYSRTDLFSAMSLPLRSDAAQYLEQHRRFTG
ncbi:hypothetical protein GCM10011533_33900 [Streptosporangium jomthongense]|nr:hypothetical protein GCM10011533_33900 [Streptosporangium jomthongense]